MKVRSFLGPMTAITAAGIPPMGSVFAGVASGEQDSLRMPPARSVPQQTLPYRKDGAVNMVLPCGCGA